VPALHLYAQPGDAEYWNAQQSFAASNPWFQVRKLEAQSHFPMFEAAEEMAKVITEFTGSRAWKAA
jgi:pimeloyl-ACP methyl ester carboxylesterase